jgi:hypothetical protein
MHWVGGWVGLRAGWDAEARRRGHTYVTKFILRIELFLFSVKFVHYRYVSSDQTHHQQY